MSDELKTLFPEVELTISTGEVVLVSPIKFGQLAKVTGLLTKILGPAFNGYYTMASDPGEAISIISTALLESGEDLYTLLSIGLKRDRAWFDELSADDGIMLTMAFIEQNSSFFVQKALPLIQASLKKMKTSGQS